MTTAFNDRLVAAICYQASHLCVGLDPEPRNHTPSMLKAVTRLLQSSRASAAVHADSHSMTEAVECVSVSEAVTLATHKYAAAYKPNSAFFEGTRTGLAALEGLRKFMSALNPSPITICDAKRGDIGNTAAKYANAVLHRWNYDCITVNPLMGTDAVEPFLQDPERGVFLLCLTSNAGAADFLLKNELYLRIAEQAVKWNKNNNVGLVVGATRAEHAAAIREVAPELPFLIPGVGAQGGSLTEILDAISARTNPRFLINASRSIMYPKVEPGEDYLHVVETAAATLRDDINQLLGPTVAS